MDKLLRILLSHQEKLHKYGFFDWKRCFTRKKLLEEAAAKKRFEYFLLGKEFKVQSDIAKKQYQKLDDTFEFDKIIKKTPKN